MTKPTAGKTRRAPRKPPAPHDGLGVAGTAFWEAMHAEHDLDAAQEAILMRACVQLDRAEGFRGAGGGDRGRAVAQERLASEAFVRMVKSLDNLIRPKPKPRERPVLALQDGPDPREALRR